MEANLTYYRRRAAEEAQAAATTPDPAARAVHLELVRRYGDLAAAAERGPAELRLVSEA